jgi:hypothetical protein
MDMEWSKESFFIKQDNTTGIRSFLKKEVSVRLYMIDGKVE